MSGQNRKMRCLVMTDFAEELFGVHGIPAQIEYGGWLKGRIPFTEEQMIERINRFQANMVVIEVDEVSRRVMEACPSLQVIASLRANPVNVDLAGADDLGIVVLNTPGRNAQAVAELALCLMLDLLRHVSASQTDLLAGRWGDKEDDPYLRFRGDELEGKTVGILGLGEIGRRVARLLTGFDAKLLAYDPFQAKAVFEQANAVQVDLPTLFGSSDIVTIHAPMTAQTRGLVNADLIGKMKPGALLINTARAHLVEKEALLQALTEGRIAAGLDVYYDEPPSAEEPLLKLSNVVCTPHIGGATREVITKGSQMVIADLVRLMNGEKPLHAAVLAQQNSRFSANRGV